MPGGGVAVLHSRKVCNSELIMLGLRLLGVRPCVLLLLGSSVVQAKADIVADRRYRRIERDRQKI